MADTARTLAQLLTLFADNIVGAITAQDGRDLCVSALGYAAARKPTVNDDGANTGGTGQFFGPGSTWIDTSGGDFYFCLSGATGAAVWLPRCCTTPSGAFTVNSGGTGVTPLSVQGVAGQTAPLQQWQVPAGTTLAEVLATGQFESFLSNLTAWIINQGSASQTVPFLEVLNFLGSILWEISQYGESLSVGVGVALISLAVNHTFTRDDSILLVDASAANRTVTLPLASTFPAGRLVAVKKIDASVHTVAIGPNVGDLLEGNGALILAKQFDWAVLTSDGVSAWYIFAANVDTAVQNAGTVTSVAMSIPGLIFSLAGSPITTAGTLALTLKTQLANAVLAGPASGVAANPTFRALSTADMPQGVWVSQKFSITFSQLVALGAVTSGFINLFSTGTKLYTIIGFVYGQVLAAESFTGGTTMGVTAQLHATAGALFGSSNSVTVGANTTLTFYNSAAQFVDFVGLTNDGLQMKFTISGDTLNHLTQGVLTVWVTWITYPAP